MDDASLGPLAGTDGGLETNGTERPFDLPDDRTLRTMYERMLLARRFDERVLGMLDAGEISGGVHPYFGQEAVAVGVCAALRPTDRITSNHRGHGHCIAKGADIRRMAAELLGRDDGYCHGLGGSMHIADFDIGVLGANGIVGAGLPISLGSALAAQLTGSDLVTVCFFGDGAVAAGPFHEALNLATLWTLPVILVCENNGWAVATAAQDSIGAERVELFAEPYGISHQALDGNDVLAVYGATTAAVNRARSGDGPTLLEAVTFRIGPHARSPRFSKTADQRPSDLIDSWRRRDPISRFADLLLELAVIDETWIDEIEETITADISRAIEFARQSPYPSIEVATGALFDGRSE